MKEETNFEFILHEPKFTGFAKVAVAAEQILDIDAAACVINCRRALEFALRWMYLADGDLDLPAENSLNAMLNNRELKQILDRDLRRRMEVIRKLGNAAAHEESPISREQALVCLENLYVFLDYLDYCYGDVYEGTPFRREIFENLEQDADNKGCSHGELLRQLASENASLRGELALRRAEQQMHYVSKSLDASEYQTRKVYLETMLKDAGWEFGVNMSYDLKLENMPAGTDCLDYLLQDSEGKALAIVELKRSCLDPAKGRGQAKIYADRLEQLQGFRPAIFLSNGFDVLLQEPNKNERKIAGIYSTTDLQRKRELIPMAKALSEITPDYSIADRSYQREAVGAICRRFGVEQAEKALITMAPGSGKTRVMMSLCHILQQQGCVRKVLFLTDKESLVVQAKRSFQSMLPDLDITIDTYDTMAEAIDKDTAQGCKVYTCGSFDLLICDEVHREVYGRYKDILHYFDAPLVGVTSIPKEELERETYRIYGLEQGVPTFSYDLYQAVKDGYLVNYRMMPVEDMSRALYRDEAISAMWQQLLNQGLKIKSGQKIGKTIVFGIDEGHCRKLLQIFRRNYPNLRDYAEIIDSTTDNLQSCIDQFANRKKLPQIAITASLLETGVDIPELVNLVFFKKIFGKSRFWQMMGRGTRLCKGLIDGRDKDVFYVFDYCGNMDYFASVEGKREGYLLPAEGKLFVEACRRCYSLQNNGGQSTEGDHLRRELTLWMIKRVSRLNRENFGVRQHLQYVDYFSHPENYEVLTEEDLRWAEEEVGPLLTGELTGADIALQAALQKTEVSE